MDFPEALAQIGFSLVGAGLGTTIVGLLFKRRFDRELEIQKAFLHRASRVHEQQVRTLTLLYQHLWSALAYQQLMSKSVIYENEKPDEYPRLFNASIVAARDALSEGRLLLPANLCQEVDRFFDKLFEGQLELRMARDVVVQDGAERAKFWDRAKTIAYKEIPTLLRSIEVEARKLIHGGSQ